MSRNVAIWIEEMWQYGSRKSANGDWRICNAYHSAAYQRQETLWQKICDKACQHTVRHVVSLLCAVLTATCVKVLGGQLQVT